MILYTAMPQELVYQTDPQEYSQQLMVSYNGIPVLAERTEDHNYRVVRVMSTDPSHFLEAGCTPGTKLPLV
ncbi:YlzJ-like family protein [Mesobacillus harenae]|uniref:YlzJ-like family protein n=1 Tax=Mesobacillus harenae TaxID=2213203 RepID=UPI00157FF07C|nr:YlzJ-like family protein [Mesobacillus harenae]